MYRRRRVLGALVLLNLVELAGLPLVGAGFWVPLAVTGPILLLFLGYLRRQAITTTRRRRAEARQAAWLAAQQAEVRRAQRRRAEARREAARLLQEELLRAQEALAEIQARTASLEAAARQQPSRVATFSYRGGGQVSGERDSRFRVRGRPYHAGPAA